ncbi:isopentenyl-diphosphate delta-isomerase 2 [Otolemur garnettii]|uniref:isopentenyl-diphosphate delta-isomerase 2 n=1 Tax=Otolemur garnettii TaxID=30611 RepID=UPI0002740049|nr:isopentenyl-diphosphate delta-isomerase 2 [Otolemur garnettii]
MSEVNLDWVDDRQRQRLDEMLILVDEDNKVIGSDTKRNCHLNENIEKGLAFCSFSPVGFENKMRENFPRPFLGYFTDSCSSHPLYEPAELEEKDAVGVRRAARRRLLAELGIPPEQISVEDVVFMTIYHHKAKSDRVWGEHEICYLLLVRKDVCVAPDPSETKSFQYLAQDQLRELLARGARGEVRVTPWLRTIAERFLYNWWPHLDDVARLVDRHTIHRVVGAPAIRT